MARAREAEPAIPGLQTTPNSSSHVIRCICSRQLGVKLRRARVIVCVQCSSGRGLFLPSILAGMRHAAVIVSRQNVKIGKHHDTKLKQLHQFSVRASFREFCQGAVLSVQSWEHF